MQTSEKKEILGAYRHMKKRVFSFAVCLVMLVGLTVPAFASDSQSITVEPINIMVGGKTFLPTDVTGENVPVFVYNGTTYAPLRALAEAYGLNVGYDEEQNLATVVGTPASEFSGSSGTAPSLTEPTVLTVSPISIEVNGAVFQPKDATGKDVAVFLYNGTTYAPLRALAEAYGLNVGYDEEKNLATVDFVAENITSAPGDKESFPDEKSFIMKEGTLFIGDSITHHLSSRRLVPMDYVGGASFMACSNAGIPHYFSDWAKFKNAEWNFYGCSYNVEFENLSYAAAIEQSAGRWERIFFMMGSNGSSALTHESYREVIDHIHANNPDAIIYLQTVPNCNTGIVLANQVNSIIVDTVAAYAADGISSVKLLDTNSIWGANCIAYDGVHLTDLGLQRWHEYICSLED